MAGMESIGRHQTYGKCSILYILFQSLQWACPPIAPPTILLWLVCYLGQGEGVGAIWMRIGRRSRVTDLDRTSRESLCCPLLRILHSTPFKCKSHRDTLHCVPCSYSGTIWLQMLGGEGRDRQPRMVGSVCNSCKWVGESQAHFSISSEAQIQPWTGNNSPTVLYLT